MVVMRRALLLVALAVVVVATTPPASSSAPHSSTPRERAWVRSLIPLFNNIGKFAGAVGKLSSDPDVLVRGSNTQLKLVVALAGLQTCTPSLISKGAAPTVRLRPVRSALASACLHYGRSATYLARGIDAGSASLITTAAAEMRRGTASIGRARRLILALV